MFSWTIVGNETTPAYGNAAGPTITKYSATFNWKNTPNSGSTAKSIKVTATYKKDDVTKTATSVVKTVTVKHIGTPGPLNIGGSTYSNGNTAQVSCSSQSISLSVPTVATDPGQSVTYTWTYPSGWSGPATSSSPSVTATSSPGGGEQLKVEARRNDGNCTTSITVNITRPLPTISSITDQYLGVTLCNSSQTKSFTASGNNATSYTWTPSGGVKINGQTSPQTSTGAVSVSATGNGYFSVKAGSSVCGTESTNSIYKDIYFGTPTVSEAMVNGVTYSGSAYINNPALLQIIPTGIAVSCSWSVVGGSGSVYSNNLSADGYAYSFAAIRGDLSNTCGSGESQTFYLYQNGSSFYRVASNPATDRKVRVIFADKLIAQELVKSLTLFSEKQEIVASLSSESLKAEAARMQGADLFLDASKAESGIYYLHIDMGQEVFKERVVLE